VEAKSHHLKACEVNTNTMKSKGLGDDLEKIFKKTGVKTIVDRVSEGLNIPCGCEGRKQAMNALFPYRKRNGN